MAEIFIYDSEGDGLYNEITKFHCFSFVGANSDEWFIFCDKDELDPGFVREVEWDLKEVTWLPISQINDWLDPQRVMGIACHNQLGFDLPAMGKLLGTTWKVGPDNINGKDIRIFDTLDMSRRLNPDRLLPKGCPNKVYNTVTGKFQNVGPHGLMAWGYRVANMKPQVDDWRNQPLETYVRRVIEDTKINKLTWFALIDEMSEDDWSEDWKLPLRLGVKVMDGMMEQERVGVYFDYELGWELLERLDKHMEELAQEVEPKLPLRDLPKSKRPNFPANPFKDDGSISSSGYNWLARLGYEINDEEKDKKVIKYPKNPFKSDGSISATGKKYLEAVGFDLGKEGEEAGKNYLWDNTGVVVEPQIIDPSLLEQAKEDLRNGKEPEFKEPMKLSNQADIKLFLFEDAGWQPTIFTTKDITRKDKRNLPKQEVEEKARDYIENVKQSPYKKFIYDELGFNVEKIKDENKLVEKIVRQGRYLPTGPSFRDKVTKTMCPSLLNLRGEMAQAIVTWLSIRNRRSVLKALDDEKETGWLNHPRLEVDHRLPPSFSGITNTHRMKHSVVNFSSLTLKTPLIAGNSSKRTISSQDHEVVRFND